MVKNAHQSKVIYKYSFIQPTVQNSKSYSVYYHLRLRKAANLHSWEAGTNVGNVQHFETITIKRPSIIYGAANWLIDYSVTAALKSIFNLAEKPKHLNKSPSPVSHDKGTIGPLPFHSWPLPSKFVEWKQSMQRAKVKGQSVRVNDQACFRHFNLWHIKKHEGTDVISLYSHGVNFTLSWSR